MAVVNPNKLSPQSTAKVTGVSVGISNKRPKHLDLLTKGLGLASDILKKINAGNEKEQAANINLAGTMFNNDLTNEMYNIQNDPTQDQKEDLTGYWKDFVDKKTLQYVKQFGGDYNLKNTYSKLLAAKLKSQIPKYSPQVQLLWNQFTSEHHKEQNGKLFNGYYNDTRRNPGNFEDNFLMGVSVITGKRITTFKQAELSLFDRITFLESERSLKELQAKEGAAPDKLNFYAKKGLGKIDQTVIDRTQKVRNYLVERKQLEDHAVNSMQSFVNGSFFQGHRSVASDIKNMNEMRIQQAYSSTNPNASMQELLNKGSEWRLHVEEQADIIKSRAMSHMERFGAYFSGEKREKILDQIDKRKDKLIKEQEGKIGNYISFYKANRNVTYEKMINHFQNKRMFKSGDSYKDKIDAVDDVISTQNSWATTAANLALEKDTDGDFLSMGFEGDTMDNGRLKKIDMAEKIQQIGIGQILYNKGTGEITLTEDVYNNLEKSGISRDIANEVISTSYLTQTELKRFLENRPEDKEINEKLKNSLQIVEKADGSVVAYHKNFAQALQMNKKHRYLYGMYVKNKMSFGGAKQNIKQEQNFSSVISAATDNSNNMRVLPYRLNKLLALGKIDINQHSQGMTFFRNNSHVEIPITIRTMYKLEESKLYKVLKSKSGSPLMKLEVWLDNLGEKQSKIISKIDDYLKRMTKYYKSKEEMLVNEGSSVEEKMSELFDRLQDEAHTGSINLKYGNKDNYLNIPQHRFKDLAAGSLDPTEGVDYSSLPDRELIRNWQTAKTNGDRNAIMRIDRELKGRNYEKGQGAWQKK